MGWSGGKRRRSSRATKFHEIRISSLFLQKYCIVVSHKKTHDVALVNLRQDKVVISTNILCATTTYVMGVTNTLLGLQNSRNLKGSTSSSKRRERRSFMKQGIRQI